MEVENTNQNVATWTERTSEENKRWPALEDGGAHSCVRVCPASSPPRAVFPALVFSGARRPPARFISPPARFASPCASPPQASSSPFLIVADGNPTATK